MAIQKISVVVFATKQLLNTMVVDYTY